MRPTRERADNDDRTAAEQGGIGGLFQGAGQQFIGSAIERAVGGRAKTS